VVDEASVQGFCERAAGRWGVPGLAVGVRAGGEELVCPLGVLVLGAPEPVREGTTFRIASITKPFTALLACSLAAEGLLDLDEPLAEPFAGVTPRQLLAHLAGLEGERGDLARFGDGDDALPALVAELGDQPRLVEPGTIWSYANAGYWTVGALCAERHGGTFEEALQARVLEPLGLERTGFAEPEARGHEPVAPGADEHRPVAEAAYPRARRPSGGLSSTAGDLLRFGEALAGPNAAELRLPLAPTPSGVYGLGLLRQAAGEVELWGHSGSYGGFESVLVTAPEHGFVFAGLTSSARGSAALDEILDDVLEAALGARREEPATVPQPAGELEAVAGRYRAPELELEIRARDEGLAVRAVAIDAVDGRRAELPPLAARPLGERRFALVGGEWDGDRFDFHPAAGPARFVRFGGRLAGRA
jgi:CubicO group peptidase (beta-lactamase class C family)